MTDTPVHLAERLKAEGEKTVQFFESLSNPQLAVQVYTEGTNWTIRQVLAHFVATEDSLNRLVTNISAGGPGAPENFNIDAYNERKVANLQDVSERELLTRFKEYRRKNIDVVENFRSEDLVKTGRHPFLGVAQLEEIIKLIYRHNQIHLRDIRRVLQVNAQG
jgi:hypothetical protein